MKSALRKRLEELLKRTSDSWTEEEIDFMSNLDLFFRIHLLNDRNFYYVTLPTLAADRYPNLFKDLVKKSIENKRFDLFYLYACSIATVYSLKKTDQEKQELLNLWAPLRDSFRKKCLKLTSDTSIISIFRKVCDLKPGAEESFETFLRKFSVEEIEHFFYIRGRSTISIFDALFLTSRDSKFEDFKHFVDKLSKDALSQLQLFEILEELALECKDSQLYNQKVRYLIEAVESQGIDFSEYLAVILFRSFSVVNLSDLYQILRPFLIEKDLALYLLAKIRDSSLKEDFFVKFLIKSLLIYESDFIKIVSRYSNKKSPEEVFKHLIELTKEVLNKISNSKSLKRMIRQEITFELSHDTFKFDCFFQKTLCFLKDLNIGTKYGEFPFEFRKQLFDRYLSEMLAKNGLEVEDLRILKVISANRSFMENCLKSFPENFKKELLKNLTKLELSRKKRSI